MITPTKIHLTNSYVLHVVDDECIINEETGDCLIVARERRTTSNQKDREYGALIPNNAIAYLELPADEVRAVLEVARNQGAGATVKP